MSSMTNYPTYKDWEDLPFPDLLERLWMAVKLADWSPAKWALQHDTCFDLPSAFWVAGHSIGYCLDTIKKDVLEWAATQEPRPIAIYIAALAPQWNERGVCRAITELVEEGRLIKTVYENPSIVCYEVAK